MPERIKNFDVVGVRRQGVDERRFKTDDVQRGLLDDARLDHVCRLSRYLTRFEAVPQSPPKTNSPSRFRVRGARSRSFNFSGNVLGSAAYPRARPVRGRTSSGM